MKIATAQIEVEIGDIDGNLKKHLELIDTTFQVLLNIIRN